MGEGEGCLFSQSYVDEYTKLPEVDVDFAYLIKWIHELGFYESNGMGAVILSYLSIQAWADLMQNSLTPFDVKTLRDMSSSFISMQQKAQKIDEPDPVKGLPHD